MIGDRVLLPAGTVVFGAVNSRHQVGIGLLHERAGLDLEFYEYQLSDGRHFPMAGRLQLVENARERVKSNGHIEGVIAADNPQHWLDGLWNRPSMTMFQHSLLGLTGMSGRVFEGFEMGPIGGAVLIAFRIAMFSLPEPEIQLPPGTEMKVSLTNLPEGAPRFASTRDSEVPENLATWLADQPFAISKPNGRISEDLVNVGIVGTREQIVHAFQAAGWSEAKPRGVRSFSHLWHSYATKTGYADAPASRLRYLGGEPELIFQKSLNTIAMRHHIRIWQTDLVGRQVWLGAATHDVAIRFDSGVRGFTHIIDPRIDLERGKIVSDLSFAGCSEPAGYVDRPAAMHGSPDQRSVQSDGKLAVITLHDCVGPTVDADLIPSKAARSIYVRSLRRVVLETRQYIVRENLYYWAFRALQWTHSRNQEPALVEY